jgi:hypothetical protein
VDGKADPSLPNGGPMKDAGKCPACMPKKYELPALPTGNVKKAGALEKNDVKVGGLSNDQHPRTPVGDPDARKVLENLTGFNVSEALTQAKVAGIGSAIIPRVSSLVAKHPGMVIPAMGAAAGGVAGAASAPPGGRISGALGGAVLGAGVGAGGQHLLRKAAPFKVAAPKLAAAKMLTVAMHATKGAPDHIKQAAIELASTKLALAGGTGSLALPLAGAGVGALAAPPGEAPRGAVRGAATAKGIGMGLEAGADLSGALLRRFPHSGLAALGGLAAIPAGGVVGGRLLQGLGRAVLPYRVGPEAQQQQEVAVSDEGTKSAGVKIAISEHFVRRVARSATPERVGEFVRRNREKMLQNEENGVLRGVVKRWQANRVANEAVSDRALGAIHGIHTPGFRDPMLGKTQQLPVFNGPNPTRKVLEAVPELIQEQPTTRIPALANRQSVHDRKTMVMPAMPEKAASVKLAISTDLIRRVASSPKVSMRRASQFIEKNKSIGDKLFHAEDPMRSPIRRYDAANAAKQGLAEKVLKGMKASSDHLQGLKPAAKATTSPSRGFIRSQFTPSFAAA